MLKLLESFAHFSLSYVLVLYLSEEFGYSDQSAGWVYGFFGMLITIYGVLVGFLIDRLGVRLALMLGSFLLLGGRLGVAVTHGEAVLERSGGGLVVERRICGPDTAVQRTQRGRVPHGPVM